MDISKIPAGRNPPYDVNVIIENPVDGSPVKYEFDKAAGVMVVDRIIHTAMTYPGNYGFIPHTLSGDGDPVDVIVIGRHPILPGAVLRVRPIGVLLMEDEKGEDEKILAAPVSKLKPDYDDVHSHEDLPGDLWQQIAHFFAHYKDLEDGKWVRLAGWEGPGKAAEMILAGIERVRAQDRAGP